MKYIYLFFSFSFISCSFAQNTDSLLSQVYFPGNLNALDMNGFNFDQNYYPSSSFWAIDSFPESYVYNAELSYSNPIDTNTSYQMRIGKGGQLYSFIGSFGESVPPQWRPTNWVQPSYGGGTSYAPWVDEVWQMVAVDGALNNPPDSSYFIHQSGVYLKTPSQSEPFYSPLLAAYYSPSNMSYSVVNWGQQAHTEDLMNINHTSHLLYYTTYTNKGNGVIQVDNMIYNFGYDNINFLNVPWGGVRNSNLDHFFISTPANDYDLTTGIYGQTPVIQTVNTGGWVAWSSDSTGNAPALGMAHPKTTNTNNNVFRYGDAGNLSATWNERDYHVLEMIRFPSNGQLGFGKSMSFRYFYVLGADVASVKNTILNNNLINNSLDTAYIPMQNQVDSIYYTFEHVGNLISAQASYTFGGIPMKTSPYEDSYPVFKIRSYDSIDRISSNPYLLSEFAYDGTAIEHTLLGFRDAPTSIRIENDTICKGTVYSFPDGNQLSLSNDTSYINYLLATNGEDSIIVSTIKVISIDATVQNFGDSIAANQSGAANYQWMDCSNGFNEILGATDPYFTPTNDGNYAVQIELNGCVDTSECTLVSSTGIIENDFGEELLVYPNPTRRWLYVALGNNYENIRTKLIDLKGREIRDTKWTNKDTIEIDMKGLKGVYLLVIRTENKLARVRVICK